MSAPLSSPGLIQVSVPAGGLSLWLLEAVDQGKQTIALRPVRPPSTGPIGRRRPLHQSTGRP